MMTREEIISKAESFGSWYHRIELVPGYFTKSRMEGSFHIWEIIRKVRAGLDYKGKSVLDIGTMDGMWAFEAEELGADLLTGVDIWQGDKEGFERCMFATCMKPSRLRILKADAEKLSGRIIDKFDIIQCLGMLYHVENPLMALREIRKCLKPDGKLLLETACIKTKEPYPLAILNTGNEVYYDPTTFWVPNKPALLDMLKLTGFKPLEETIQTTEEPRSYRICMICETI